MDLGGAISARSAIFAVIGSRLHLDSTMGCKNMDFCAAEKSSTFNNGNDVRLSDIKTTLAS